MLQASWKLKVPADFIHQFVLVLAGLDYSTALAVDRDRIEFPAGRKEPLSAFVVSVEVAEIEPVHGRLKGNRMFLAVLLEGSVKGVDIVLACAAVTERCGEILHMGNGEDPDKDIVVVARGLFCPFPSR